MVDNFFKKVKTNLLSVKSKLVFLSEFRNFGFILNVLFWTLILLLIIDNNLFFALEQSFFNAFFTYLNYSSYFYVTLTVLFILSIKNFLYTMLLNLYGLTSTVQFSNNSLYLDVLYLSYLKNVLIIALTFLLNYVRYFFSVLINSNYVLTFIWSKILYTLTPISFYPIFKRHSIFGYYRIARQNWVELKTEEVNFLKY